MVLGLIVLGLVVLMGQSVWFECRDNERRGAL